MHSATGISVGVNITVVPCSRSCHRAGGRHGAVCACVQCHGIRRLIIDAFNPGENNIQRTFGHNIGNHLLRIEIHGTEGSHKNVNTSSATLRRKHADLQCLLLHRLANHSRPFPKLLAKLNIPEACDEYRSCQNGQTFMLCTDPDHIHTLRHGWYRILDSGSGRCSAQDRSATGP